MSASELTIWTVQKSVMIVYQGQLNLVRCRNDAVYTIQK